MAIFRMPYHCIFCGELIKEIHHDKDSLPLGWQGFDTFIEYEEHLCKPIETIVTDSATQASNEPDKEATG